MFMLSCRETARLTSEALDHPLSWSKRFALKFHLSMCKHCKRYTRQLQFIHQIISLGKEKMDEIPGDSQVCLSDDAKVRIREAIQQDETA